MQSTEEGDGKTAFRRSPASTWYGRIRLTETCQHVAGRLLCVAEMAGDGKVEAACTDLPCKWIVPAEAKKPAPRLPLADISFRKHHINKPLRQKKRRQYNPAGHLPPATKEEVQSLQESLSESFPSLQALRYMEQKPEQQAVPETPRHFIGDEEDLWSERVQGIVCEYLASLKALDKDECERICRDTIGQADNKKWHAARVGRLTGSLFKRACRCVKPESLLKRVLYPSNKAASEAMLYGRLHEKDAVEAYALLLRSADRQVALQETGLHVLCNNPLLAASPDRIVTVDGEEGLLEVKCPFSKQGQSMQEACQDRRFCCRLDDDDEAVLKTDHEYYFQVQGQMAITGHDWCDFVVWFGPNKIHLQRIKSDSVFWETEMLPSLLHFIKHDLIPEALTRRVRLLNELCAKGKYVSYKKLLNGFYVCNHHGGLVMAIKRFQEICTG
ncbi:hypothetical protein HPB50_011308 [Hyalomma asiaticum]|uniref:Uncharacterized protein n=1 Tax=Hyalomma asiaticum TaxID=266040 RepID=A0ACB7RT41_HYAAI|nr:hypothetical protein HPB50_011308 [Hyalomma asiaticum]